MSTELGVCNPRATAGVVEGWIDVARDQKKLGNGEKPGDVMRYASLNTTVLTRLIENIENKPFVEVFQERFWSKPTANSKLAYINVPQPNCSMGNKSYTQVTNMATCHEVWEGLQEHRSVKNTALKKKGNGHEVTA